MRALKRFPPFGLDIENELLLRERDTVPLTPKSFAVLRHLVENAGRLVTKEELLGAVWPDTFIQEAVLKSCVGEIRRALGDDAAAPTFIQTRHRLGYQFIASVTDAAPASVAPTPEAATEIVGRDPELGRLRTALDKALAARRQVVFVSGEAGIGKTSLVNQFLALQASRPGLRIARGQCLEQFGEREAYYPVLDAIAGAARHWQGDEPKAVLRRVAPTWLLHLPGLVPPEELDDLRQRSFGATGERMLREMSEVLEALAASQPLLFVLEDLHWSDLATLDLLTRIAHRTDPAQLMVIATYRPIEVILGRHPLKAVRQELYARRLCTEISLEALGPEASREIIARRLPERAASREFADDVFRRTEGHPLFLVNVLDYAASHGELDSGIPETIAGMIEKQLDRLDARERGLLETASVAGSEFPLFWLAEASREDPLALEETCEDMARKRLFLRPAGNQGGSSRYAFLHALYREVLYRRLGAGRRTLLHKRLGEWLERTHAGSQAGLAPELAFHFEQGADYARAVHYLELAAHRAGRRNAPQEGCNLTRKGIALSARLPESDRGPAVIRLREQLGLLLRLGGHFSEAAAEFAAMESEAAAIGSLEHRLHGLLWRAGVLSWMDREQCLACVDEALALSGERADPRLRAEVRGHAAYWNLLFRHWRDEDAEASAAVLDAMRRAGNRTGIALFGGRHSYFEAMAGRYRSAWAVAEESVRAALEADSLLDFSIAHYFEAWALLHLGEWGEMRRVNTRALALAERNGHAIWTLLFRLLDAWLDIHRGQFARALEACEAARARARAARHEFSQQMSTVLIGHACLGLGDLDRAHREFEDIAAWQSRQRLLMDWIWKMPLAEGLFEVYYRTGDAANAAKAANEFRECAHATAEPTWQALGCRGVAAAAALRGDRTSATTAVAAALERLTGVEAPLAEWRVCQLAFDLGMGDEHASRAREIQQRLLSSLGEPGKRAAAVTVS